MVFKPVKIEFAVELESKKIAFSLEYKIKRLSKKDKELLCLEQNLNKIIMD